MACYEIINFENELTHLLINEIINKWNCLVKEILSILRLNAYYLKISEFFNLHFKYYLNNLFNLSYYLDRQINIYTCLQDSIFKALKIRVLFTTTNHNSINSSFHFSWENRANEGEKIKGYRKDWLISRLMHRSSLRQIQIILRRQNFLSFPTRWPKQNSRKNKSFSGGSKKPEVLKGLNRRKDRSMDGRETTKDGWRKNGNGQRRRWPSASSAVEKVKILIWVSVLDRARSGKLVKKHQENGRKSFGKAINDDFS